LDTFPEWSPDGTQITFVTERDGNREIYVMNSDGSGQTNISNDPNFDNTPDWGTAPDMAAVNTAPVANDDLVFTVVNGSLNNINVLANDTDADFDALTITAVTTPINGGTATINATNNGIDFTALTNFRGVDVFIYTISDGNGGFDTATVNVAILGTNGKIAFFSNRDGNNEIYSMNSDGTLQTRLTTNASSDFGPSWNPNGEKIAFTSFREVNSEIFAMNADGSGLTRLTNSADGDEAPDYSPDGAKIAFTSDRDGEDFLIYTMNADGTGQTILTPIRSKTTRSQPFRQTAPRFYLIDS